MNKYLVIVIVLLGITPFINTTLDTSRYREAGEAPFIHGEAGFDELEGFETNGITEGYSVNFYETPVLNYASVATPSNWKYGAALGYEKIDAEGDGGWELILWYPRALVYWSLRKGVILNLTTQRTYFSKPVALDLNRDGRTDYVIHAENPYLDGHAYPSLRRVPPTRVIVRNPIYVRAVFELDGGFYVSTNTYHIYGNRVFIPWVKNTPFNATVGLIEVVFDRAVTFRRFTLRTYASTPGVSINDYTTNYEVFLVGSNDRVYVIPSGLERVLQVRITDSSVVFEGEISLGYSGVDDHVILLARQTPSVHVSAYAYYAGTQPTVVQWVSPTRLDLGFDGRYIVIPYGRVFTDPLALCYFYGVDEFYCRMEYIEGVVVVDLQTRQYRYINLLSTSISLTTLYVDAVSKRVLYGGLGYAPATGYSYYIRAYRYDRGVVEKPLWVEYSVVYTQKPVVSQNLLVSPEKIKLIAEGGTYEYVLHAGRNGDYWLRVASIVNPSSLDMDGDGALELVFLVYYADGDYYPYCGPYQCAKVYPIVTSGTYVAWFTVPRLNINLAFPEETRYRFSMEVNYISRGFSNATVRITHVRSGEVFRKTYKSGVNVENIVLRESGEHSLRASSRSSYHTGWRVDHRAFLIAYSSDEKTLTKIYVKYKTRIRFVKPTLSVLTPNLYADGLNFTVVLEAFDWVNNRWFKLPAETVYMWFTYGQSYCLIIKDYGRTPPEPPLPIPLNTGVDGVELCPGYNGGSLSFTGSTIVGDGGYGLFIGGLKPGEMGDIVFGYNGTLEKLPTTLYVGSVRLIKHPVLLSVSTGDAYAFTKHQVIVYARYLYLTEDGSWHVGNLSAGVVRYVVVNQSSDNVVSEGAVYPILGRAVVDIDEERVMPGVYAVKTVYQPDYRYDEACAEAFFTVHKLSFNVTVIDKSRGVELTSGGDVLKGALIQVRGVETAGSTLRNVTVGLATMVLDEGGAVTYVDETKGSVLEIPTSNFTLGKHVVVVHPLKHRWVYEPPGCVFVIYVTVPGRLVVEAKPVYRFKGLSHNETIALTPTEVRVKLLFDTAVGKTPEFEKVKLIVENKVIEIGLNDTYLWTPIYPGLARISAYANLTPTVGVNFVLEGYADIYVHEMPVEILVKPGSIIVDTRDALGRRAPGRVLVEIRDTEGRFLLETEGEVSDDEAFKATWMGYGWIYVYVEYHGNESYREAWSYTLMELKPKPIVVDETHYVSIALLSTVMLVLFKRLKEHK